MKWESFIKKLRSELTDHSSEVNADEIWKNIEPAVDRINLEKEQKRRLGWLPLILLLLFVGGGAVYLNFDHTSRISNAVTDASNSVEHDGTIKSIESSTPISGANSNQVETGHLQNDRQAGGDPLDHSGEIGNKQTVNQANGNNDLHPDKMSGDLRSKNHQVLKRQSAKNHERAVTSNKIQTKKELNGISKNSHSSGNTHFNNQEPVTYMNHDLVSNPPLNELAYNAHGAAPVESGVSPASGISGTSPVSGLAGSSGNVPGLSGGANTMTGQSTVFRPLEFASLNRNSSILLSEYSEVRSAQLQIANKKYEWRTNPNTDCPRFGKIGMSFLIGVHGGVSYPFTSTSSTSDGDGLLLLRDSTETSLVHGNMGIDFMMRHRTGFEITVGLQRSTLMERLDLLRTVTTTEIEQGIQAISINPLGDTIIIIGDVPVTTTTTERKRFYNKYHFVEIPLIVGYSREIGNWRVGGEAGVVAGILTKTEGKILDENVDFSDLNGSNDAVSGSSFGMSYHFAVSVAHIYESGIELGFSPNVRFAPSDFSAAGYPIRKKYLLVGANVSLRYRFGGK